MPVSATRSFPQQTNTFRIIKSRSLGTSFCLPSSPSRSTSGQRHYSTSGQHSCSDVRTQIFNIALGFSKNVLLLTSPQSEAFLRAHIQLTTRYFSALSVSFQFATHLALQNFITLQPSLLLNKELFSLPTIKFLPSNLTSSLSSFSIDTHL